MGHFDAEFQISADLEGERRQFSGMVDTGATYTTVPASLLRAIGVRPFRTMRFELADGDFVVREIAEARVFLNGDSAWTYVAFGEEDAEPILGVHALESLRLVVDTINHRLAPVEHLRA